MLRGAQIWLDFPSVGATENILMAAVLADGTTVIDNAAREPEIVDLCRDAAADGRQDRGHRHARRSPCTASPALQPTEHRVIGDRIVGATWAFAAAMTRGEVTVRGVDPHHLDLVLDKLRSAGAETDGGHAGVHRADGRPPAGAIDFVTLPYPGFATDLQPMAIALSAVADGTSMITENVFEARFRFVDEMVRLGADARTDGHHAVVRGRRAALQRAGVGQRHPRRRRAGARGPVRRGRDAGVGRRAHRPRLPAVRREPRRASAPTSPGCSPTRSD